MDKIEALERIKTAWNDRSLSLKDKIVIISSDYYSVGLELSTTAAFIKATPSELEALLSLGGLDDDIIEVISEINPPKTTWILLASASEDEIKSALDALAKVKKDNSKTTGVSGASEFVYQQMIEVSGPTQEQRVGMLSGADLSHALKKGKSFNALNDWQLKFLRSIASQKKRGKVLSDKQEARLLEVLTHLAESGAIKRDSIDGDSEICDRILDAIGK